MGRKERERERGRKDGRGNKGGWITGSMKPNEINRIR
jgi:hypothetical protein